MKKTTKINILSLFLVLMVAVAAGKGLYHSDVYSITEPSVLQLIHHQDFTILAIFVPLLLFSIWLTAQSHFRGVLLWIGTVGYLSYVYCGYSFGGVSEELFVLHIAITGLSFYLLFNKLATIDPEAIRLRFTPVTSLRVTSLFMMGIAVLTEILWFQEALPFFRTLLKIDYLKLSNFLAIQVLDSVFLGPLSFLAGFWLFFHKARGYVSAAGLLVIIPAKFGTMITKFNYTLIQDKISLVFAAISLFSLMLLVCFLKKIKEEKLTSYHNRISDNF